MQAKGRMPRGVVPVLIVSALVFVPTIILFTIDSMNVIQQPPTECATYSPDERYCHQSYLEDGLVRFSISVPETDNCCVIERYVLDTATPSYRMLMCDVQNPALMACGATMGEIVGYPPRSMMIGGRKLTVDTGWGAHFMGSDIADK